MKSGVCFKFKFNILFRKFLLNLLLMFFSPRNTFIVILSQNLDKHIVLYQKAIFSAYKRKRHKSKSIKEIAA